MTLPCGWTADPGCCPDWDTFDPALQASATDWAILQLWRLSGAQFSACSVTTRPCYQGCQPRSYETFGVWMDSYNGGGAWSWVPFIDFGGDWRNCGGGCWGWCSCGARCELWLPPPVQSIQSVKINGVALVGGYRVDNRTFLVREDGDCWPTCQDYGQPANSPDNTFEVVYTWCTPVPADAAIAAGALACEFAKACTNQPCSLSPQITNIVRDGISFQIMPAGMSKEAPTGVAVVDAWLRSVNPRGLRRRPRVDSPDLHPPRVQTYP